MGDEWDYKLKKAEMAWQLATRMMPNSPDHTGKWQEQIYLKNAQEVIKQAYDIIDAIFIADKPTW